jgi:DNA-binding response OmpR family regulator
MSAHEPMPAAVGSILIVEDEILLSTLLEDLARDLGAQEVHICADMASAERVAATERLDAAILDVRVGGGTSFAVADILAERGVPFLFSTGLGGSVEAERHAHRPLLEKPFSDDDFRIQIMALLGAVPAPAGAQ